MMIIHNISKKTDLSLCCRRADTFFSRFKGLMGIAHFPEGSGLLITPCNSIHMFFMKIPLDIVFIDENDRVLHVLENIQPWKLSGMVRKARSVIELPTGTVKNTHTEKGDQLVFQKDDGRKDF